MSNNQSRNMAAPNTQSSVAVAGKPESVTPYIRPYVDETRDFNMVDVLSTLRPSDDQEVEDLTPKFHWYADAVPIDAIFPPGIALTAKEILAFYPHHVRWQGIMLRLASKGLRGNDIVEMENFFRPDHNNAGGSQGHPVGGRQMTNYMRDSIKSTIPYIKLSNTTPFPWSGNSDKLFAGLNLPGSTISRLQKQRGGLVAPSFDDLVRGLTLIPSGLDARVLTSCVQWWLLHRDDFEPPLQFSVLHVQALARALRIPLRPCGPQDRDRVALRDWKGGYCSGSKMELEEMRKGREGKKKKRKVEVEEEKEEEKKKKKKVVLRARNGELVARGDGDEEEVEGVRDRVEIDPQDGSVKAHVQLQLRHVLLMPFLGVQKMVGEALKMGVEKLEEKEE